MIQTRVTQVETLEDWTLIGPEAAQIILNGGLVAFPTETVYGLGANALDAVAVEKIYQAKGRPANDPIIVHLGSADELKTVAENIPAIAWELAQRFWPGPLSLILPKNPSVPYNVTSGLETVAVRVPSHPIAQAFIRECGVPIAAPSANQFGHTSPTTAQHVLDDLEGRVELIIDAGPTSVGVESTVLDLSVKSPTILRPGGVTVEELAAVLGTINVPSIKVSQQKAVKSPGLLSRHYAPQVPLILVVGEKDQSHDTIQKIASQHLKKGKRVGLLLFEESLALFDKQGFTISIMGSRENYSEVAHHLFARIRQLEAENVEVIIAQSCEQEGVGLAVHDRLTRAASQLIHV